MDARTQARAAQRWVRIRFTHEVVRDLWLRLIDAATRDDQQRNDAQQRPCQLQLPRLDALGLHPELELQSGEGGIVQQEALQFDQAEEAQKDKVGSRPRAEPIVDLSVQDDERGVVGQT